MDGPKVPKVRHPDETYDEREGRSMYTDGSRN